MWRGKSGRKRSCCFEECQSHVEEMDERTGGSGEGCFIGTCNLIAFVGVRGYHDPFVSPHLVEAFLSFSPSQCL